LKLYKNEQSDNFHLVVGYPVWMWCFMNHILQLCI